jgi:hypothetical protein
MSEDGRLAAGAAGASYFAAERDLPESPRGVSLDRPTDAAVAERNAPAPGGPRSSKRPAPKHPDPARVLAAFNTWSFKREQPTDPQLMLRFIAEAIGVGDPIPFLLYWGKGPRNSIAPPDLACLDYLAAFAHRIERAYEPGAALRLIFTDTHAQLNGHSPSSRRRYFGEIEDAARQRGFDSCWLGALTHAADLGSAGLADTDVPPNMINLLAASAMKWYRGEGTCEQGAAKYYRMNMVERRAVELAFPRSIFITFNGSQLRGLLPERLPIFHMYSLRRGVAVKPWFLPAEIAQADGAPLPGVMAQLHEG